MGMMDRSLVSSRSAVLARSLARRVGSDREALAVTSHVARIRNGSASIPHDTWRCGFAPAAKPHARNLRGRESCVRPRFASAVHLATAYPCACAYIHSRGRVKRHRRRRRAAAWQVWRTRIEVTAGDVAIEVGSGCDDHRLRTYVRDMADKGAPPAARRTSASLSARRLVVVIAAAHTHPSTTSGIGSNITPMLPLPSTPSSIPLSHAHQAEREEADGVRTGSPVPRAAMKCCGLAVAGDNVAVEPCSVSATPESDAKDWAASEGVVRPEPSRKIHASSKRSDCCRCRR
jgi:hypothetical protein